MPEITVKWVGDHWEIFNDHRRFEALLAIGNGFKVMDLEGGNLKIVQIENGEARIASNVIIF